MQKVLRIAAILVLSLLLAVACQTVPRYGHGSVSTDLALLTPPFRGTEGEPQREFRVGLQAARGVLYNEGDVGVLARAFFQGGHNLGHAGFAYGGSAFGGLYTATSGTRSYIGGTIQGVAMLILPLKNVEFRILGAQAAISVEGGEFYRFRAETEDIINLSPTPFLISAGFLAEVAMRFSQKVGLVVRGGLGGSLLNPHRGDFEPLETLGAQLSINALAIWMQIGALLQAEKPSFAVGATYRLF